MATNEEALSQYARVFDQNSAYWQDNEELNRIFVELQQNYANQRLRSWGHLFLNEVYDSLGFSRTPEGQLVGWIWVDDGDCYVDFGLNYDKDILNIQLDFNVDGVIYEKI